MPFVEAKCTNCGAVLPVDSARDAWVCGYCGTPFVVEKAIQQFNITNNISASVVNVIGGDTADVMYNRALEWLALGNEAKAVQVLGEITEKYPGDVRGWAKLAHLCPDNVAYLNNAISLGDEESKEIRRQREQQAVLACAEVRNGHGEKWIRNTIFIDPKYNSFSCVNDLLSEGKENAAYFFSKLEAHGTTGISFYRQAIAVLWGVANDALYRLGDWEWGIIGNMIGGHKCNQIITKHSCNQ